MRNVFLLGTDRPRSPGKYQRTPTKRSRNSVTPQAVPSDRAAPASAISCPTIKSY
jgi:hypothetical protein